MTSRAITRYVVYLPPPIRTTPFDSTVTRCSRDALTVDPSDGAMSGRSPAYVPTTSSRVRSTSIVAFTVSSSRSTSQPAADGWSGGPSYGASVVPISQWSGHGTRKTTLPGTRMVRPVLFGIRSRGTTRWAPRLGRIARERPRNGWSDWAAQTPVASTIARVGMRERRTGRQILGVDAGDDAEGAIGPQAGGADPSDRHGAGGERGPGHGQACSARRPRPRRCRAGRRAARSDAGSEPARESRPSTAVDASRRPASHRACRTGSGRRHRTSSRGTACRRSGRAAARS